MSAAESLDELCPECGNFVSILNEVTGFCIDCSLSVVGVSTNEAPTTEYRPSRIELWLRKNADTIESLMLDEQWSAKVAIRRVALEQRVYCKCCGERIPNATSGRHFICNKQPRCRKARRYYKYLVFEKGRNKDEALAQALKKFKKQQEYI